jgi:mycothiol synthase
MWSRAEEADGVAPVSEAFALAATRPRSGVVHLLREAGGDLAGYAQVSGVGEEDAAVELVVDPAHRRAGHGRALLDAALASGGRRVWAHGNLPAARSLAAAAGLVLTRSLHLMGRPLTDADAGDPALPPGYSVRAFEPGPDDEAWVALNAAAFARHPEQGRLTVPDLHERMEQAWFDPAGFLLVERDGHPVAFHWTKVEPGATSGEVYVVGVHPDEQGRGLGSPLTALGLAHLARLGLATVHLYVDGDNAAALRTYRRLGFTDLAVDGQYSRPGT